MDRAKISVMIKRIFLISTCLCIAVLAFAKTDSLAMKAKLDSLTIRVEVMESQNSSLKQKNEELLRQITALEHSVVALQGQSETIEARVSNTEKGLHENSHSIQCAKEGLSSQIKTTDDKVTGQETNLKHKTIGGIIIAVIVLLLSALLTFLLHRRGNDKIDALSGKAEKLNEEIVNRMSSEFGEIQKIANSIGSLSVAGASSQNEQDLIKALADRITFMEMTLYRMDSSIRGHRQLTKSISQMKNNLLANGYEIVDMLGKPYHEGMKVTANFVEDENIEQGQQIITGIIKPQINYQGKMIQAAQITVSQNI